MINDVRTALVTGGASGIGRAIAIGLAAEGWQVTATGVDATERQAFDPLDYSISVESLDVTDEDSIGQLVQRFSSLDLLVNCAGAIGRDGVEFEADGFQQIIKVNLTGTMGMSRACRDLLAQNSGCIINMASMLSFFGSGFVPAYSASKGAVAQLTKSLAIAWAPRAVRVNAIAPGWIRTALTEPLYGNPQRSDEILRRTPLGRWGEPEDVVGAALFLASPAARFITGVILPVDGGYSIA